MRFGIFGAIAMLAVMAASAPRALAQPESSMAAFVGTWALDPAKTTMERAGPSGVQTRRADSFTWVFVPHGRYVDLNIYHEYPAPAPSKIMAVVTDGKFHPCAMKESCLSTPGDPKEQSFAFWQMDARMAVRIFRVRGVVTEYNAYAVSADGKTFVATSWSPQTPQYRNTQVFVRQ